ncbi:MAG: hypothetical protein V4729_07700 [Pseudomonadota bacterium]
MKRGAREKHAMIQRLEQLRAIVRAASLSPSLRTDLELVMADVERDILVPMSTETSSLRQALVDWEPRLRAARQPALAAAVDEAAADLGRMGLR